MFAGGGGIVTKQIKEALGLLSRGAQLILTLEQGITPKSGKKSATDTMIELISLDPTSYPMAKIIKTDEYRGPSQEVQSKNLRGSTSGGRGMSCRALLGG